MTILAFSGGAGCGKTYRLMQALIEHLVATPLKDGQKVLALTFMHGSRRRLEERIGQLQGLRGSMECSTVDSFAWRLVRRWSSLVTKLGFTNIEVDQYDRVCDAAGALLQVKEVCGWVAATFPVLLVDEAQDLTPNRLQLVAELSTRLELFAAADEFQCLDEALRPNPACSWLEQECGVEELVQPRRTNVAELLDAAGAIRNGEAPKSGKLFKVAQTSNSGLAGTWLTHALAWYGVGKKVAVITPTLGTFANATVEWTAQNQTKKGFGPYAISWEKSESQAANSFISTLALNDVNDIPSVVDILTAAGDSRATADVVEWMDTQRRARAKEFFSREEIAKAIKQGFAQRRRMRKVDEGGWKGMTVHGAKNREFDNVIVLWPAAVVGCDDQKRRLLYNAITRAKQRCLVLVQAKSSLLHAPFA